MIGLTAHGQIAGRVVECFIYFLAEQDEETGLGGSCACLAWDVFEQWRFVDCRDYLVGDVVSNLSGVGPVDFVAVIFLGVVACGYVDAGSGV